MKWCDVVDDWDRIGDADPPLVDHDTLETEFDGGVKLWTPRPDEWLASTTVVPLVDQIDPVER